jgi:inositol phosphorylceramide synthase catalytic subunit
VSRWALQKSLPLVVLLVALGIYGVFNPLRLEHLAILVFLSGLILASRPSRSLAVALLPAAIFGFTFDLLRLFAERSYEAVIVEPIYRLEAALFGWMTPGDSLGPVDFFGDHHHLAIDLAAGLTYSTHVPAAILFGVYLWWQNRRPRSKDRRVHKFMWGYLIFNAIGFGVWVLFPVAPPWYVQDYGLAAPGEAIIGDPAGLARVDAFLNYPHFANIYEQGTYVFGALPSLHVAPPLWIALWAEKPRIKRLAWAYTGAMSFFAVYLGHHYIVDVLAGWLLAGGVYALIAHTKLGELCDDLSEAIASSLEALVVSAGQPVESA